MRRLPEEEYEYTEMVQQRLPSPPPTRVPLVHKLQTLIPGMLWYTERTYERIFRDPRDDDGQPVHSQALGNIEIVRLVFAGILAGAGYGMHRKTPEDALLIPVTILGSIAAYVMWTAAQASMLQYFRSPAVSELEQKLNITREKAEDVADEMYHSGKTITETLKESSSQ